MEFTGKSGIYGIRYLSQGFIERQHHHDFVRFEISDAANPISTEQGVDVRVLGQPRPRLSCLLAASRGQGRVQAAVLRSHNSQLHI